MPALDQVLSDSGAATFEHGRFNGFEIRRLIVADMFFACDIHGSTDIAEELANDIEKWLFDGELGYQRKNDGVAARAYASEIEFTLDQGSNALSALVEFGDRITERVRSYGNETPAFSFERMLFGPDPAGVQLLKTVPFALERRATLPHSLGLWYSAAPLKTEEHIEALKLLLAN